MEKPNMANRDADEIKAEIGKVFMIMRKRSNGECQIEFCTDCVDPDLNCLQDFANNEHHVEFEPELMFIECLGSSTTRVAPTVYDAVRRWVADNTDWRFVRMVDDRNLIGTGC